MDIKQGDKMFKKGKENITVGVFNWSKDYASAASNFDEACTYKIRQLKYTKAAGLGKRQ